ncbi:MAG TPA: L-seryl-tRNA(Sec) selenium transferase [Mycobacteriales bacterium]|jgi:L-seryl-tRNA(Ser) seleniumtransferase|nr:L-seryl-tRNA(Sec) selenium transferase [Mycobacteriales bacterium]
MTDDRRAVPRTDAVLAEPRLVAAAGTLGRALVKDAVVQAQALVRSGQARPEDTADLAVSLLPPSATTLRPVLNCTGVVLHTNLGRAPLSDAAVAAMRRASGYTDVEYDVQTGRRATRGRGALAALIAAVPEAAAALVVNNGAAALVLATTALAAGREVVISRGEMVEIGDGFRLPDLIASTGARIREVGTTNRTSLADYVVWPDTGCVLKVHQSNFRITGFTGAVGVRELAGLGAPVVVDVGSGLLRPDPLLADEPDVTSALRDGAAVVTCSGDKLLGGPQAGLIFGTLEALAQLRAHPLYRAFRCDKTTLAALEATLRGPEAPIWAAIRADGLRERTERLAARLSADVAASEGAIGGGGAPGVVLPGWAVSLPEALADPLREGTPCVVGRVVGGRLLLDLRCVDTADDDAVASAVLACMS